MGPKFAYAYGFPVAFSFLSSSICIGPSWPASTIPMPMALPGLALGCWMLPGYSWPDRTKDVKRSKKNILLNSRTQETATAVWQWQHQWQWHSQRVDIGQEPVSVSEVLCPLSGTCIECCAKMASGSSKEQRACNGGSPPFWLFPSPEYGQAIAANKFAISNFSIFNLGTKDNGGQSTRVWADKDMQNSGNVSPGHNSTGAAKIRLCPKRTIGESCN